MPGLPRRRSRRGVTLLEITIVVAVFGVLAAIGGSLMVDQIPRYRTRRAAEEFAASCQLARARAIAEGVQYRVAMVQADTQLDSDTPSVGTWWVQAGNAAFGSTTWDTLPIDEGGVDLTTSEGNYDISEGAANALPGVSIEQWSTISGGDGDDIIFSPRGMVENPSSDFNSLGYIEIVFVNKRARLEGRTDEQAVLISPGGLVHVEPNRGSLATGSQGTQATSTVSGSASTGYVGG